MPRLTSAAVDQLALHKISQAREIQASFTSAQDLNISETEQQFLQNLNFSKLMQYIIKYFDAHFQSSSYRNVDECSDGELIGLLPFPLKDCPSLASYATLQAKVSLRVFCAVTIRPVVTLYDLESEICLAEGITSFRSLGLGLSVANLEVCQKFFKMSLPPSMKLPPITAEQFVAFLQFSANAQELLRSNANSSALVEAFAKEIGVKRARFCGIHIQNLPWLTGYVVSEKCRREQFFRNRFRWQECRLENFVEEYQSVLESLDDVFHKNALRREISHSDEDGDIEIDLPLKLVNFLQRGCRKNSANDGKGKWRLVLTCSCTQEKTVNVEPPREVYVVKPKSVSKPLTNKCAVVKKKASSFVQDEVSVSLPHSPTVMDEHQVTTYSAMDLLKKLLLTGTGVGAENSSSLKFLHQPLESQQQVQMISDRISALQKQGTIAATTIVDSLANCVVHLREINADQDRMNHHEEPLPPHLIESIVIVISNIKSTLTQQAIHHSTDSEDKAFYQSYFNNLHALASIDDQLSPNQKLHFHSMISAAPILLLVGQVAVSAMDSPIFFPAIPSAFHSEKFLPMETVAGPFRVVEPDIFRCGTTSQDQLSTVISFLEKTCGIVTGFRWNVAETSSIASTSSQSSIVEEELISVLQTITRPFRCDTHRKPTHDEHLFFHSLCSLLGQCWKESHHVLSTRLKKYLCGLPWLVTSSNTLCIPSDVYYPTAENVSLLGNTVAWTAFSNVSIVSDDNHAAQPDSNFLAELGVQMTPTASLVLGKIEALVRLKPTEQKAAVSQMNAFYSFLSGELVNGRQNSSSSLYSSLTIQRIIFVPFRHFSASTSEKTDKNLEGEGRFVAGVNVFWEIPTELQNVEDYLTPLSSLYSCNLREFFAEFLHVPRYPTIPSFWTSMEVLSGRFPHPSAQQTRRLQFAVEVFLRYLYDHGDGLLFFENAMRRMKIFPTSLGWKSINESVFFGCGNFSRVFSNLISILEFVECRRNVGFDSFLEQLGLRNLEKEAHRQVVYDTIASRSTSRLHDQIAGCVPYLQQFLRKKYPTFYAKNVQGIHDSLKTFNVIVCMNPFLCYFIPGIGGGTHSCAVRTEMHAIYVDLVNTLYVEQDSTLPHVVACAAAPAFVTRDCPEAVCDGVISLLSKLLPLDPAQRKEACQEHGFLDEAGSLAWELSSAPVENFRSVFPPGTDGVMMKINSARRGGNAPEGLIPPQEQEILIPQSEQPDQQQPPPLKKKYAEIINEKMVCTRKEVITKASLTEEGKADTRRKSHLAFTVNSSDNNIPMSPYTDSYDLKTSNNAKFSSNNGTTVLTSDEQVDSVNYARAGEKFVYESLLAEVKHLPGHKVCWLNEKAESGEPYDIILFKEEANGKKQIQKYVEVKSTRTGDKRSFEMTLREFLVSAKYGRSYSIFRVYNAAAPTTMHSPPQRIEKYEDPIRLWHRGVLVADGGVRMVIT